MAQQPIGRHGRRLVRVLLLGWMLLLALAIAYQGLGRYLVTQVSNYQSVVEQELERLLDSQVHFEQLSASWHGWSPRLHASGVAIGDAEASLSVHELHFRPDFLRSLLGMRWHIAGLDIRGLQLELSQDANGNWHILRQQLSLGEQTSNEPFSLAALNRISSFSLLESSLLVRPFNAQALEFAKINLSVDRQRSQRIQASIELPDQQSLQLVARGILDADNWADTNFSLFVRLPDTDIANWLPSEWLGVEFERAQLAGQFWLQFKGGELSEVIADITSGALQAKFAQENIELQVGQVLASYTATQLQRKLWFERLQLGFAGQQQLYDWPLFLQQDFVGDELGRIRFEAKALDVAPIAGLLQQFLPNQIAREVFSALNPSGQLRNIQVAWNHAAPWEQRLVFDTNLADLEYSRFEEVPGASGINGRIFGGLSGGELQLDTGDFSLFLAEFFAQPWHYDSAKARLTWELNEDGFRLRSPYLQVKGVEGDIAGDFDIRLFNDPQLENYMDLRVGMRDGDAAYAAKYLPLVLEQEFSELDQWLRRAIKAGQVRQGYFQYQGSINSGTPEQARSISLYFDADNAVLDYETGWPELHQAKADVFIHDWGVQVEVTRGQVLDSSIRAAKAQVDYVDEGEVAALKVSAELDSSLPDGLYLLQKTPLAKELPEFADWRGKGKVPASFNLWLPFSAQTPRVDFSMLLDNASLALTDIDVELEQLSGQLAFDTETGLGNNKISGRFLQQQFELELGAKQMGKHWINQLKINGVMDAARLQNWLWPQLELPLAGQFPYQALINIDGADSQMVIDTDFKGMILDLPQPFTKQADQSLPSSWRASWAGREPSMRFNYANLIDIVAAKDKQTNDLRAAIEFGSGRAKLPTNQGIYLGGRLQQLDVEQWQPLLQQLMQNSQQSDLALLQGISLKIGHFQAQPLQLSGLQLDLRRNAQQWVLRADSDNLQGRLESRQDAPLLLELEHLRLPAASSTPEPGLEEAQSAAEQQPESDWPWQQLPTTEFRLKHLYQGNELVGSLEFDLLQQEQRTQLSNVLAKLHGLEINGDLVWQHSTNSQFVGSLAGKDIGQVLQAWGYTPTISSEKFKVEAELNWPGQPQHVQLLNLAGEVDLSFSNGQLMEVDSSAKALRVFGLLNFNSIGRRLRLDFSDLLGKGLSYDRLRGKLIFNQGKVHNQEPLVIKGVSSELSLTGKLDLHSEQVQAQLAVAIPISNNLPLAAVLVGAPAIGGALFLADRLVGNKINRFATVNYHISGNMHKPDISIVEQSDEN